MLRRRTWAALALAALAGCGSDNVNDTIPQTGKADPNLKATTSPDGKKVYQVQMPNTQAPPAGYPTGAGAGAPAADAAPK